MKDTLLFLLSKIVDNPDALLIDERSEGSKIILAVHADQKDMGKIIGKNGRIIRALRDLIKLMATKENAYVDVVVVEEASESRE